MNQEQFIARRQSQWQELAAIMLQVQEAGAVRLPPDRVVRLGRLYRQTASDLAYVRTYFPSSSTAEYLNQLVSQAHGVIYAAEPERGLALWRFYWQEVPTLVREARLAILLAALLFVAGGLVGWVALLYDPNLADALISEQLRSTVPEPRAGEILAVGERPLVGTMIMLNNIQVGVFAFGLGMTLGIGTAGILLFNGLQIGVLAALFYNAGLSNHFWSLILPHGILELMAVFQCGGAGFVLGWSIVAPGELSRKESLGLGARRAVRLVAGSVPLFVIAAAIEGWVTPMSSLPIWGKYMVALLTGLAGFAYWSRTGARAFKADPAP